MSVSAGFGVTPNKVFFLKNKMRSHLRLHCTDECCLHDHRTCNDKSVATCNPIERAWVRIRQWSKRRDCKQIYVKQKCENAHLLPGSHCSQMRLHSFTRVNSTLPLTISRQCNAGNHLSIGSTADIDDCNLWA